MRRIVIFILLLMPAVSHAQGLRLRTARSIYIANDSKNVTIEDLAYTELMKWGRFTIVSSPKNADLVLHLRLDAKLTQVTKDKCLTILIEDAHSQSAHELGDVDDTLWFDKECGAVSWSSIERRLFDRLRKPFKNSRDVS